MRAEIKKIAGINTIFVPGSKNDTCIVLFHGYGADAQDLAPLCQVVGHDKFSWVFPEGIETVDIAPGYQGRAWFDIDSKAIEEAMMRGEHRDLTNYRPKRFSQAIEKVTPLIKELMKQYKKVVIGGFSQGAMLSTELALALESKPQGLIILSGALVDKPNWEKLAKSCKGLKYFQSHGETDPILSYEGAEALDQILTRAGMDGSLLSFKGGHEIPKMVLDQMRSFLQQY